MTPYSETLIDQVVAQLKTISTTGGYSFTVKSVQRFDREELSTSTKPCIHVFQTVERKTRSGSTWDVSVELSLDVYVFEHELLNAATAKLEKEAGGDVENALCQLEAGDTFRATIEEIETLPFVELDEEETVEVGVNVAVTLGYRVDFADPRTPIDPE
jgi:tRNA(Ser,Leu) C12 N-acetylase TAN1